LQLRGRSVTVPDGPSKEQSKQPSLADVAAVRAITIDDLSDVRHLHASAFRTQGAAVYTEAEIEAFSALVYSTPYMDRVAAAACYGAWIDTQLVGTCSWAPADDDGPTARIGDLFVGSQFARCGLGRMLIGHAEMRAREAGFVSFSARLGVHAAPVFERLGYVITSHGVHHLSDEISLVVVFMRKPATKAV